MSIKLKTFLIFSIFCLAAYGAYDYFILPCTSSSTPPITVLSTGDTPSFSATTIDHQSLSLDDYKGQLVIIDFWATWCPPCVKEIPHFIELQNQFSSDLQIIGVSLDDNTQPVVEFCEKNNVNYPIIMGSDALVSLFGGITGIPTTFILTRDHQIYEKVVGYRSKDYFESIINKLK